MRIEINLVRNIFRTYESLVSKKIDKEYFTMLWTMTRFSSHQALHGDPDEELTKSMFKVSVSRDTYILIY